MLRGVMWMTLGAAAGTQLSSLMSLRGGSLQLIDATGAFNKGAAAEAAAGASADLALITSVGAQARGRRLLNDLFGTDFSTDASDGGAWLAASSAAPAKVLLVHVGEGEEKAVRSACAEAWEAVAAA